MKVERPTELILNISKLLYINMSLDMLSIPIFEYREEKLFEGAYLIWQMK